MSEPFVFDPRCTACKDPFGAVPCGQPVSFHCRPLAQEDFTHCALVMTLEFAGETREQELAPEGPAGGQRGRRTVTVGPCGTPRRAKDVPAPASLDLRRRPHAVGGII